MLYKACDEDEFPTNIKCLQTFYFDRCTDWPKLLGLWQGVRIIQSFNSGNPDPAESDYNPQWDAEYREQTRQAVAQSRIWEHLESLYIQFNSDYNYPGSGNWHWYLKNKARLKERAQAESSPPEVGCRVLLQGLVAKPELNDAAGQVVGFDATAGRFAVKLSSPPSAVLLQPEGVRVQPRNMTVLPKGAARAVLLSGPNMGSAFAFDAASGNGWQRCPVPTMLGQPLAVKQLGCKQQHSNEQLAVFLCVDPDTGLAPAKVQTCGMGPTLVARSDGKDFTIGEMMALHSYIEHLKSIWPDEGVASSTWKQRYLTAAASEAFTEFTG